MKHLLRRLLLVWLCLMLLIPSLPLSAAEVSGEGVADVEITQEILPPAELTEEEKRRYSRLSTKPTSLPCGRPSSCVLSPAAS